MDKGGKRQEMQNPVHSEVSQDSRETDLDITNNYYFCSQKS